jgi:hypothetical protein
MYYDILDLNGCIYVKLHNLKDNKIRNVVVFHTIAFLIGYIFIQQIFSA